MSNALTTAARPLVMDASAKAVLMALCDMAREPDDPDRPAQTWPPMRGRDGAVGICDWTCLTDRAVQQAMKRLVAAGHVSRVERPGRGVVYTVHPRTTFAPEGGSPPNDVPPEGGSGTPERRSDKAPISTSRRKKTTSSPSTRVGRVDPFPMPDGANPQHWRDFLANRARKRLPNTASAHKRLMDDLTRHAGGEWTVPQLIEHAAGAGWAGIYSPGARTGGGGHRADPDEMPTVAAAKRAMAMMTRTDP